MKKRNRTLLLAFVLQIAALALVVLAYLFLRGLATEEPAAPIPYSSQP